MSSRSNLTLVFILAVLAMFPLRGQHPASGARPITASEARALVKKLVEVLGTSKLPSFAIDQPANPGTADFYFFEATWDNRQGSVIAGHYAVDRITGDVWDAVVCKEFTYNGLKRLQATIRKRHGISEEDYRKMRRAGPMC